MKIFQTTIIKLILILALPVLVEAAEFHVSKSWELALALRSADVNGADDTIFLDAGTYSSDFIYETNETNSLTIKAEEEVRAEEIIVKGDDNGSSKFENNSLSLTIENITFNNIAIRMVTNGKVIVNNCIFDSLIQMYIYSSELTFMNNIIKNIKDFYSYTEKWLIVADVHSFKNNRIFNNYIRDYPIIVSGRGILTFENNKIFDNRIKGFDYVKRSNPWKASLYLKNNIFAYNEKFYLRTPTNTFVQNNTIINSDNLNICQNANTCLNNLTYKATDEYNPFIDPENNDFHLKPDSPCIDAGTNDNIPYTATDIEGNPRIANGTVDLGAYEFTTNRTHPADTNQNWIIESEEFSAYNTAWKNATNWPSPPNQIPAEYLTRSGFLLKKGGRYKDVGLSKPLCWMPDN